MIKTLQKKFIISSMTAISILLIFLISAINISNIFITENQINKTIEIISKNNGNPDNLPPVRSEDSRPMLSWIFANDEYTVLYHQYMAEFLDSYFSDGYFSDMMDTVFSMIAPYVEKDPTKFCTYEEFEAGFEMLRQFCLLRAESVSAQLDGTIPSTSDGQKADSANLIDASSIDASDMGAMNTGKGGMDQFGSKVDSDFSFGDRTQSREPMQDNAGKNNRQPSQEENDRQASDRISV